MQPAPRARRALRWGIVVVALSAQLTMLVRAYHTPQAVYGYQMFPESSQWQADISRVTRTGARVDIRGPWPGEYRWDDLVAAPLSAPFGRQHATAGLTSTLHLFAAALDWVAGHTPDDHDTVRLEAAVTYWRNGRGPFHVILSTSDRSEALP